METITNETLKLSYEKGYNMESVLYTNFRKNDTLYQTEVKGVMQYEILDWLREKHNIYISIRPWVTMSTRDKVCFYYKIYSDSDGTMFNNVLESVDGYVTYEECLEYAIQESLKKL